MLMQNTSKDAVLLKDVPFPVRDTEFIIRNPYPKSVIVSVFDGT